MLRIELTGRKEGSSKQNSAAKAGSVPGGSFAAESASCVSGRRGCEFSGGRGGREAGGGGKPYTPHISTPSVVVSLVHRGRDRVRCSAGRQQQCWQLGLSIQILEIAPYPTPLDERIPTSFGLPDCSVDSGVGVRLQDTFLHPGGA